MLKLLQMLVVSIEHPQYSIISVGARANLQVAGGDMKQKQADNLIELATEVGADVQARQLHAAVRTTYKRAAFQAATSNEVRISLDTDMKLVDEVRYYTTT